VATAVADTVSNCVRVVKTVKQAAASHCSHSYWQIISKIVAKDGLSGLLFRGLYSRILADGVQSILFTVLWKLLVMYFDDSFSQKKEVGS
jgi:hypothetical protein